MASIADAAAAARAEAVSHYSEGFRDGVEETLRMLERTGLIAGAPPYTGPVPAELADWIGLVRCCLEEARADA